MDGNISGAGIESIYQQQIRQWNVFRLAPCALRVGNIHTFSHSVSDSQFPAGSHAAVPTQENSLFCLNHQYGYTLRDIQVHHRSHQWAASSSCPSSSTFWQKKTTTVSDMIWVSLASRCRQTSRESRHVTCLQTVSIIEPSVLLLCSSYFLAWTWV